MFAAHADAYSAAGLPCFPVDTRRKRPAVRNWQRATPRSARAWAEKFPHADGLGVVMGEASGLTEIDVDIVGDAALGAALERFGESPITIRTASGKSKIWYRHNGERRLIRPVVNVDVLGSGFTVAPPSWRDDLGAGYRFLTGSLADVARLPTIRRRALEAGAGYAGRPAESVQAGERNNRLFRFAMTQARSCDDLAALEDVCTTWNEQMPDPLSAGEVGNVARSAWGYEARGSNFVGLRKPQVTAWDAARDSLLDFPDAFMLLHMFEAYHSNRKSFAIAPGSMSEAGTLPWHRTRIRRARDVLLERGFLEVVRPPDGRRRLAGQYRLTRPDHGHNHFTLPPPL
ncbi:bifunctional DNA primase/polymerase [Acuticoccus sp. MNP-M23]|uniref:bifunctional DNA primase/polymerase n=1 Tax=Acuticoccus sp. MNP-M23 TaxID=3072793 RepID=UPI0028167FE1|nr:bifunctional DNA primase/polymerase [Acuticoccus sp. MNP-M23]WMS43442.1 bifunctional DNA primase/polymerase [Acuticoccus sp. MNP-M23]